MRLIIGVQARSDSKRLPNKIYKDLVGESMLKRVYKTCEQAGKIHSRVLDSKVVVLGHSKDMKLADYCEKQDLEYFAPRSEASDVLGRYVDAIKVNESDAVIRVTADCPLITVKIIDAVIGGLLECDYSTNVTPRTFIDGWDCQGIWREPLFWLDEQASNREHVFWDLEACEETLKAFASHGWTIRRILNSDRAILNPHHPANKASVDTQEDLERVREWIANGSTEPVLS